MSSLHLIAEGIFFGFTLFVPFLLVKSVVGRNYSPQWVRLIDSVNTSYLLVSLLGLVAIGGDIFMGWYSASTYTSYHITGIERVSGKLLLGIYLLNIFILPQLMWFKGLRTSLISSAVVLVIGVVPYFLQATMFSVQWPFAFLTIDSLLRVSIFLGTVGLLYIIKAKT